MVHNSLTTLVHLIFLLLFKNLNLLFLHSIYRFVIIRFLSDFGYQFSIRHFSIFTNDNYCTCQQTAQWSICHTHAIAFIEIRKTEIRQRNYIFNTFRRTKTSVSKRQVFGNRQYHGVRQTCCQLIELAHRRCTNTGVQTREDIQYHILSFQIFQRKRRKVSLY